MSQALPNYRFSADRAVRDFGNIEEQDGWLTINLRDLKKASIILRPVRGELRVEPSIFRSPRKAGKLHASEASTNVSGAVGSAFAAGAGNSDRRCGDRRQVLKSAMIVFNDGHCTLGCRILNVSDTGALVMPSDLFLCPDEFVLKPKVGSPRDCEIVWRKNDRVGVRYI
jgi:hypothetical protein